MEEEEKSTSFGENYGKKKNLSEQVETDDDAKNQNLRKLSAINFGILKIWNIQNIIQT